MGLALAANAHYVTPGDFVDAVVFLEDVSTSPPVARPRLIREGKAVLFNAAGATVDEASFDALEGAPENHFGNADGAIRVWFFHPADTRGLSLRVDITTFADEHLSLTVPVVPEVIQTALAPQRSSR